MFKTRKTKRLEENYKILKEEYERLEKRHDECYCDYRDLKTFVLENQEPVMEFKIENYYGKKFVYSNGLVLDDFGSVKELTNEEYYQFKKKLEELENENKTKK